MIRAAALVASLVALTACGRESPGSSPPARTVTPAEATARATGGPLVRAADLADGRHAAYLTAVDPAAGTVTFDVVQFLTGEPARDAWRRDHPEEPDGPPNDYYIVNDNPRLRTASVTQDAEIRVLKGDGGGPDLERVTLAQLPDRMATRPGATEAGPLGPNPFWLTLRAGVIGEMEEQFRP